MDEKLILALEAAKEKENYFDLPEDFYAELIKSSISFEDETLKLEEVEKVLKGNVVGINSEKVAKITNQKNALNKAIYLAKNNIELDENQLKDLHQLLAEGNNVSGGLYRNVNISVRGSNHTPCSYEKVYDRMDKYFLFISDGIKGNKFEYIAYLHLQLLKIHPFLDCNGRLARLVLNYALLKEGFAPVIYPEKKEEREEYFNAIEAFKVEKEIVPFVNYLLKLELKSLELLK